MHLSGQLTDWSISDLLQIMQVTTKTGSLDIEGDRRGRVHFKDGEVTGADLTGAEGSYLDAGRGGVADVLYVLSTLETGSFSVGPADGPDTPGWTVEDVMADVDALKALEGEVIEAGLFEAAGVRIVPEISDPIEISSEDWTIIASLVQPFTFNHLETTMGRGNAVRVFHALHRLGVAEVVVGDEDESEWLDRLADDISPESGEPTSVEHVEEEAEELLTPEPNPEPVLEPVLESVPEPISANVVELEKAEVRGVSAPASTTLTDGVYDEIRRLRSKVADQ